jgi:hypothetical protein
MPDATVHCTTDGSIPTSASPVCTSLTLDVTMALQAITVAPGYADSPQVAGLYVIDKPDAPPSTRDVNFTFLADNLTIDSSVPVNFRLSPSEHFDFQHFERAFLTVNGKLQGRAWNGGFGYFSYAWNATTVPDDQYTLQAYIVDSLGNTYSQSVVVTVSNEGP